MVPHEILACSTVHANSKKIMVLHGSAESLYVLPCQHPAILPYCCGKHYRQCRPFLEKPVNCIHCSLSVQRVKNSLNQEYVNPPICKCFGLPVICLRKIFKADVACNRYCPIGRPD